jgi:hypothetical protein
MSLLITCAFMGAAAAAAAAAAAPIMAILTLCTFVSPPAAHEEQPWHWQALPQVPAIQPHPQQPGSSGTTPAVRPGQQRQHSTSGCSVSSCT